MIIGINIIGSEVMFRRVNAYNQKNIKFAGLSSSQ